MRYAIWALLSQVNKQILVYIIPQLNQGIVIVYVTVYVTDQSKVKFLLSFRYLFDSICYLR